MPRPQTRPLDRPATDADSIRDQLDPDELGFDEIVFVKRKPYSSDHYYTDINNGTSPDRFLPDNGIYIYNLRTRSERAVVTAADLPGGQGFIGKISLSFDARKIVFDFRQDPGSGFRIWEVNTDGTGLRQISFPPEDEAEKVARWSPAWHTDDIHPCYLPDGKIIFSSTRCEHTVLCGGSSHLVAPGLHRMDADGIARRTAHAQPGQRILPGGARRRPSHVPPLGIHRQGRPRRQDHLVHESRREPGPRNSTAWPTTRRPSTCTRKPIPGSDHRLVCVGTCHFPQGGCLGAIMLIDFGKGVRVRGPDPDEADYVQGDDRYSVTNITPHVFIERRTEPGWHFLTEDGRYVHDRERPARAPLHASVSRQRPGVPGLLQGRSVRSLQGSCQRLRAVPDRYRGKPSSCSRRRQALLLASPAAGRAARPAARATCREIPNTPPAIRPSAS